MKFKKVTLMLGAFTALSLILSGCGSTKTANQTNGTNYPVKTIKIVSALPEQTPPSQIAKQVAGVMAKKTGWKFEFAFAPGNSGQDAADMVWNAPHDGYTVLSQTENLLGNSATGLTKLTTKDWSNYEMYAESTALVVSPDSPYKTLGDIVEAAKKKPGSVSIECPGKNSAFYLKAKVLERVTGAKFDLPEGLTGTDILGDLNNKKVDAVIAPLVMLNKGISDGRFIALAVTDEADYDFGGSVGKVASVDKAYPEFKKYMPIDAQQGFALPKDTPKDIVDAFGKAFDDAMNSPEIEAMIQSHDAIKLDIWGDNATGFMSKFESNYAWLVKDLGLGNVDPGTLGIPKPQWLQ